MKIKYDFNEIKLIAIFVVAMFFPNMTFAGYQTNLLPSDDYLTVGSNQIDVGSWSAPIVYDWNSDGKKDLLVGQSSTVDGVTSGRISFFENIGTDDNPLFNTSSYIQSCSVSCTPLEVTAWG